MNKLIGIFALVILCSCAMEQTFNIQVTGTSGLKFTGSLCLTTPDGKVTTKSIEGAIPANYTLKGSVVSVVFQKQTEKGTLQAAILKNGNIVNSSETTAAYGVVSITSP